MLFSGQELGLSSPTGAPAMILWGKPAAPPPSPDTPAPAPAKPPPPPTPDAYVPYVRPVAPPKPIPPDPASAAGQDIDPNSLLNFHRQLSQLHRGTTALHDGEEIFLNHDDENALVWVRKPATPSLQNPAVGIICNLSGKPLTLSLRPELTRLRLRGNFLRKILRSDDALGSVGVDTMTLPPLSVYIGELRL
jgi:hypothetical protein